MSEETHKKLTISGLGGGCSVDVEGADAELAGRRGKHDAVPVVDPLFVTTPLFPSASWQHPALSEGTFYCSLVRRLETLLRVHRPTLVNQTRS